MKVALISDTFLPLRTSGAVQMLDLARAMAKAGHEVVVMVPDPEIGTRWRVDAMEGFQVLRLRSPKTKDVSYARRLVAEWRMPHSMYRNWQSSPLRDMVFEGVAFYSPSIFHTALVKAIMRKHGARSYLILRDIFPDWTLDMGLMKPGPAYSLLKAVAKRQYHAADVIGVQSPGNLSLLNPQSVRPGSRVEVLHNWLEPRPASACRIDISATSLAGRRICVYAGNIGVAQKLDIIVETADLLRSRSDIGFVLVGRGNDVPRIAEEIAARSLPNILMFDEIGVDEISGLYSQCDLGLVVLDERHRTHNIPGKFVSYMHAGLPVFAVVNPNNDLISLVESSDVGAALHERKPDVVAGRLLEVLGRIDRGSALGERCKELAATQFSADHAAAQVVEGLRE